MTIDFNNATEFPLSEKLKKVITRAFKNTLEMEGIADTAEMSLSYVTPQQIKELNGKYRGIDKETDVLSFPIYNSPSEITGSGPTLLGDIFINPWRAQLQAEEFEHSFEREILYLSIHSLLHLLGYDHEKDDDYEQMEEQQEKVLKTVEDDGD